MDYLFDNPLANLPSTHFLALYGALIAVSVIAYQTVKKQFDITAQMPVPPVPINPDIYEIAFLRGGENELARSVIFALVQKGYLQIDTDEKNRTVWVQQTGAKPDKNSLQYIEQKVYEFFDTPKKSEAVFAAYNLRVVLKAFAVTYKQRLENSNLLTSGETQARVFNLKWSILIVISSLGIYRLLSSVVNGYFNIGFLLVFLIAALVTFALLKGLPRTTALGKHYLERLELAFASLKWQISHPKPQQQAATTNGVVFNSVDPTLLAVGVFGASALAGTAYDSYHQAFYKSQQKQDAGSSGGGCGGGCGSSWDSGDSSSSCSSSCSSGSSCSGGSSCGGGCGGGCGG